MRRGRRRNHLRLLRRQTLVGTPVGFAGPAGRRRDLHDQRGEARSHRSATMIWLFTSDANARTGDTPAPCLHSPVQRQQRHIDRADGSRRTSAQRPRGRHCPALIIASSMAAPSFGEHHTSRSSNSARTDPSRRTPAPSCRRSLARRRRQQRLRSIRGTPEPASEVRATDQHVR